MSLWNTYHLAHSIHDALNWLSTADGPARLIAGGTDLLLDLQQGRHPPVDTLVDVTAIPELTTIELRQDNLFVGAGVPLNRVVSNRLACEHARALVEACGLIGGPQVRNTATLGGNVAHALPAADGTIALLALGASAEIATSAGCRLVPIEALFLGPGQSALDRRSELLVGFYLPLTRPRQASAFKRVMRPQGVALPILNLAAWLSRQDERIVDFRLAVGPAGRTPFRARAAEARLQDRSFSPQALSEALEALLEEASFRTSPHRASADYRRQLAGVLLEETVAEAWKRASTAAGGPQTAGA
jgi:carbon-monoxide dehydrogenase medium subunit